MLINHSLSFIVHSFNHQHNRYHLRIQYSKLYWSHLSLCGGSLIAFSSGHQHTTTEASSYRLWPKLEQLTFSQSGQEYLFSLWYKCFMDLYNAKLNNFAVSILNNLATFSLCETFAGFSTGFLCLPIDTDLRTGTRFL
jgi:hypothetical protein